MNLIERRRGMVVAEGEHYNWVPMQTQGYKSWTRNNGVTLVDNDIVFKQTSAGNCNLTSRLLQYAYNNLPSLIFRISYDYDISDRAEDGYLLPRIAMWNSNSPGTNGVQNYAKSIQYLSGDRFIALRATGVGHYESIMTPSAWNTTINTNQYVGIRFYCFTGVGSTVKLSNITFDVHVPN